jgi:hypothetical protein
LISHDVALESGGPGKAVSSRRSPVGGKPSTTATRRREPIWAVNGRHVRDGLMLHDDEVSKVKAGIHGGEQSNYRFFAHRLASGK